MRARKAARLRAWAAWGLLAFVWFTANGAAAQEPVPFRLQLLWHHQAQFAGIYVAQTKDYYRREGIELELIEGGPAINPLQSIAQGRADAALSWLPNAVAARERGWPVVNFAQAFRRSGTAIACRRDAGIADPSDIAGKRIGVWRVGDELNVRYWLPTVRLSADDVRLVGQRPDGVDLIQGRVPCATVMMYNEYWSLLDANVSPADLMLVRLGEQGLGFLEDGFYTTEGALADPRRRDALARFLRATAAGWAYARNNVEEAHAIVRAFAPSFDPAHQRRMLDTVLGLVGDTRTFGLLDLAAFEHSIDVIAQDDEGARAAAAGAWTHGIWYEAGLGRDDWTTLAVSTRHHLIETVSQRWFYALDLIGTVAFGIAGFMRARQRHYDLWGAFVLTLLPAAGGGTVRDLLVGGDRHPPFIFQDPAYISIVLAVVVFGTFAAAFAPRGTIESRSFDRTLALFDTMGMATFAVIGAKVALVAGLFWIWVPFCSALTCAGGGMLLDIVTGREPRTFRGEPYEEIAVLGGLVLLVGLQVADTYEHHAWLVPASIGAAMATVFTIRSLVIVRGWRSYCLGVPAKSKPRTRRGGRTA